MKLETSINKLEEQLCAQYAVRVCWGAELEFYLRDARGEILLPDVRDEIALVLQDTLGLFLEEERGLGQYEVATPPVTGEAAAYSHYIHTIRQAIIDIAERFKINVEFAPKPFLDDHGSALHLHFNLNSVTAEEQQNLFATGKYGENQYITRCIYGVLSLLHSNINLLCAEEDILRLSSKAVSTKAKHHIPAGLCWGGNNRTTALRIPNSPPEYRRLELRVPSANCCPWRAIEFVLQGIKLGLDTALSDVEKHLLDKYPRIYGNAHELQYNIIRFDSLFG